MARRHARGIGKALYGVAVLAWVAKGTLAAAQAGDAAAPPARAAYDAVASEGRPVLEPPRLLELGPPSANPLRPGAAPVRIPLELIIDAEGRVEDAKILESAGAGEDAAALAAVRQSRFSPARRNGAAVPARVRFVFELASPKAAAPPPSPAPVPASASVSAPIEEPAEVIVRGASAAQRLRESAEAVTVIETKQAKRESADLGEVLARSHGTSVRRSGGLGSAAQLSLNGLTDQQIRFFLDGIPLEVAGFGLGLENVPVNLVERVEVYRGVVPIRLGADALGGAVNLVGTEDVRGTRAAASAQLGSFGTYRLTLSGRHTHASTGLFAAATAFVDHADNDYPVEVDVADLRGNTSRARVHRFHDAFRAYGGTAELGFVNRSWAKRLVLRVHGTRQDKELQHNVVMSVPYGEARYWEAVRGAVLRYEQPRFGQSSFGANAVLAVSRQTTDFQDTSGSFYDWFGRPAGSRNIPGELGKPSDQRVHFNNAVGRLQLSFMPSATHALRLAVAPTFVASEGHSRLVTEGRDPLTAERRYFATISGLEYEIDLFSQRLEAITFAKSYWMDLAIEEPLHGGTLRRLDQDGHTFGYGEALRLRLVSFLWLKASYERATRLPSSHEVFGDSVLVGPNLRLVPERSHNANVSLTLDVRRSRIGELRGEVNAFIRDASQLIVLLGNNMAFSHQNVDTARSQGVELGSGWTSPGSYLAIDGNFTWQSLRNDSSEGTFRDFKGDRLPNRPWLFANATARAQMRGISAAEDELALTYHLRYVHDFFRGWESVGLSEFKDVVPAQTTHGLVFTYLSPGRVTQSWAVEVQNLTDARAYDFFGVQRPGRAFYAKVTLEY